MALARNQKDLIAGLLFLGIGLAMAVGTTEYDIGTARRMGPGYFPMMLSGLLVILGLIVAIKSFFGAEEQVGKLAWGAMAIILVATIGFGLLIRGAGLVPATIILTVVSLAASIHFKIRTAIWLSAGLAVFSWIVFTWGLGLPMPAFGTWFF